MEDRFAQAIRPLPPALAGALLSIPPDIRSRACEVRLRRGKPISVICARERYYIPLRGGATCDLTERLRITESGEIDESLRAICGYSLHSHTADIAEGFVTVTGGHRVGICGTAVISDGAVINQKNISGLNIRIAREFFGIADGLLPTAEDPEGGLLIAGSPGSGKTTLLRELTRRLSEKYKVALIDERGELAAMRHGEPQNDVGINTDVLDGYPKGIGILQAVRTMSPEIVICDEIGDSTECEAVATGINSGVRFIASVHAANERELCRKPQLRKLLSNGAFGSIVFLTGSGKPSGVERIVKLEDIRIDPDSAYGISDRRGADVAS